METQLKEVKAEMEKVNDQIKSFAEKAEKEIKAHAQLSDETKASVDKLLVAQGELTARLQFAEQVINKLEQGGSKAAAAQTLGQYVAGHDSVRSFAGRGSVTVPFSAAVTSGDIIAPARVGGIVMPGQRQVFVRDLLAQGMTASNSVEFVRELAFTNSAAPVSENPTSAKPNSALTFELDSVPVATIAHYIKASKQVLSDAAMMQSYIDGRLRYGLKIKEEAQLLNGSGVGLNISGLVTEATAYSNPGVTVQAETAIDRLRLAILQVALSEYDADGIILSPIDWAAIELTKTTLNSYIFASPTMQGVPTLWGKPIVATQAMGEGDFLVGAFSQAAQVWDREDANVTISNSNEDDFIKNMVTILCEERVGLTVYRPDALVAGDFDGLPASE